MIKTKKCLCGCGGIPNVGKIYVHGHNGRVANGYKGKKHSSEVRAQMRKSWRARRARGDVFVAHTSEAKKVIAEKARLRWATDETYRKNHLAALHTEDYRKRQSKAQKRRRKEQDPAEIVAHVTMMRKSNRRFRKTRIEQDVEKIVRRFDKSFKYTGDGSGRIGRKIPDFVSEKQKKVIEVNGAYWHDSVMQKQRDKKKVGEYKRLGYTTLSIGERELKRYPTRTENKIRKFVHD